MRWAVVGTRTFNSYGQLCDELKKHVVSTDTIITGEADGADFLARSYALAHKMTLIVHRARWEDFGLRAGPMRNQQIVDDADAMIAFWNGTSKGTYDALQRAKKKGIKIVEIKI